jgi:protein gp37
MLKTKIQWTDKSHNFWHGCRKVSPGCKFCYMYRLKKQYGQDGSNIYRLSDATFYSPLYEKEPCMIFTCSFSDFFLLEADLWREDAWSVIKRTPHIIWQILTKRPERVLACLPDDWGSEGYPNVWLGVSIETQEFFYRAEILSKVPAKIRFISAEPLLGEIDFLVEKDGKRIIDNFHWVILGGESGDETGPYGYRPSKVEWYERAIVDLKEHTNVAVFNKQLGCHLRNELKLKHYHGGAMEEWPINLQIREFPVGGIEYIQA